MEDKEELTRIIDQHALWLASEESSGTRADLRGTRLDDLDLSGVNLSGAWMSGASLQRTNLSNTELTHADLTDAELQGADLTGASLLLVDFTGANLENAKLVATKDQAQQALGRFRRGPRFKDANLKGAEMRGCYAEHSDFTGSVLEGADFTGARLAGANFSNNDLSGATFSAADLARSNLSNSDLVGADLGKCHLNNADLTAANISCADLSGADLRGANLDNANVEGVNYDRNASFRGIRVASCYGSSRFRRFAQDQDYLEEFKASSPAAYWVWYALSDCGRSMARVLYWSIGMISVFAAVFFLLGEANFLIANRDTLGWNPFTAVYYSVVTFTTLGFGDVTPRTPVAAAVVMVEVVVGYIMLGILISILATKVARRS